MNLAGNLQKTRIFTIVILMFSLFSCRSIANQDRDITALPIAEVTSVISLDSSPNTESLLNVTPTAVNFSTPMGSSALNTFLLVLNNPEIQIWQYQHLQTASTLLYENRNPKEQFHGLLEDIIPSSELTIYQRFDGAYPTSDVTDGVFPVTQ